MGEPERIEKDKREKQVAVKLGAGAAILTFGALVVSVVAFVLTLAVKAVEGLIHAFG